MIVYPAIDLMGGVAVRLRQGDPARGTTVGDDPVGLARRWAGEGAEWLHVVDLDGAFGGEPRHLETVRRICRAVEIPVQVGGGIRRLEHLREALDAGAARVVIGTAALDGVFLRAALDAAGERLAAALDVRDGRVAAAGWTETTDAPVLEAAEMLRAAGMRRIVYTDILRDGMLTGPNIDAARRLITSTGCAVIVSGGVGGDADVRAASAIGADGVIIGRALYDGRMTLGGARRAAAGSA
jgi:phosphoribosylformimino-5-aminoimidazole carboxamide ribotide isomerase